MSQRSLSLALLTALAMPLVAQEKPADVFGSAKLHAMHLVISAENWKTMQPANVGPMFGKKPGEGPGAFGFDFTTVPAKFEAGGQTLENVGVRFKGNSSYMMSARGLKRPFKIDFNHYDDKLRWAGLKEVSLSNNFADPSQLRETLAYNVFRAAGVPASRTAFVELSLTVPGKYDREFLGLYTLIEVVDKAFLKDRLDASKGMLLKPERVRQLDYLGESWDKYVERYRPKGSPSKDEKRALIAFTKLVHQADDTTFAKEIGAALDIDLFMRFLAVHSAILNLDSFMTLGHNYYMYLHPGTKKFIFLPWDLNHSFGGFSMGGAMDQQINQSIDHPNPGEHKLIDRLLAIPEHKKVYRDHLDRLLKKGFVTETLQAEVASIQKALEKSFEKDAAALKRRGEGFGGPPGGMGRAPDLAVFVSQRAESIAAQLEGKRKGVKLTFQGPGMMMNPGPMFAKRLLEAGDADGDGKLSLAEWKAGAEKVFAESAPKGELDQAALGQFLNRRLGPPGFGPPPEGLKPPPMGGGFKPPMGFGPGTFLAPAVFKRADLDKSGMVPKKEWMQAAESLAQEWDANRDSFLQESELSAGIGKLLPAPGFPGPGKKKEANP